MKKLFAICYLLFVISPAHAATEISDTEIETVMAELIAPLSDAAGIADGRLRAHILADGDFNAFVMGGEDVFINSGLIEQVRDPAQVQAVIAHELGHMQGGHIAQMSAKMRAEMKGGMAVQALGLALAVLNPTAGMGVMMGGSGIARTNMLSFSRDEERLADQYAIDLLRRAKLDPCALHDVMKYMSDMAQGYEARANPHNSNHPMTSERLKNIQENAKCTVKNEKIKNEKYDLIRAKLIGYLGTADRVKTIYPQTDKSTAANYARTIASMRGGDLESAKTGALQLIHADKNNPYYYELLGDIEYQYGHYDDSVSAYEKSLSIIKNAPQIESALALVLSERNRGGDRARAATLAKKSLLIEPAPLTYYTLARATTGCESDFAMAEYYNLIRNKNKTREFAKSAQQKCQKNSPEYIKAGDLLR